MGVWEGLPPTSSYACEVPLANELGFCTAPAVTVFLPAFESSGGWTGDNHEYAPRLEIAYVCEKHKPERLKEGE